MSLFSALKKNARLALRKQWGKAAAAALIVGGASSLLVFLRALALMLFSPQIEPDPAFVSLYGVEAFLFERFARVSPRETLIVSLFALLHVLLLAPLTLGLTRWYSELIRGRPPALTDLFRYYESARGYLRALLLEINLAARAFLWALVFFAAPGGILCLSVVIAAQEAPTRTMLAFASVGTLLSAVLFLLAAVFYLAFLNRYTMAAYLACEDDAVTVRQAIRDSIRFTKGYRFRLLWFLLSFAGWLALCFLLLPALYVLPYLSTATLLFYRFMAEKSRFTQPYPTREFGVAEGAPPSVEDGRGDVRA